MTKATSVDRFVRSGIMGLLLSCAACAFGPPAIPPLDGKPLREVVEILGIGTPGYLADLRLAEGGDSYAEMSLLEKMLMRGTQPYRSSVPDFDPDTVVNAINYIGAELESMLKRGFGPAGVQRANLGFNPRYRERRIPEGVISLDPRQTFDLLQLSADARWPAADACVALASAYLHEREPDERGSSIVQNSDGSVGEQPSSDEEEAASRYRDETALGHALGRALGISFQPDVALQLLDRACVQGLPNPGHGSIACERLQQMLSSADNVFGIGKQPELAKNYQKIGAARDAAARAASELANARHRAIADEERYEMSRTRLQNEVDEARRMELFVSSLKAVQNANKTH